MEYVNRAKGYAQLQRAACGRRTLQEGAWDVLRPWEDLSSDAATAAKHCVFISYRRLDDRPPPDNPRADGFVQYLHKQLRYELEELGSQAVLWRDRLAIAPAEDWTDAIESALREADLLLAVLSRNYVTSDWCEREIETFADRVQGLEPEVRRARIFRVDKHKVSNDQVPSPLRSVQAVDSTQKTKKVGSRTSTSDAAKLFMNQNISPPSGNSRRRFTRD